MAREDQDWAFGYSEKYVGGVKVMFSNLISLGRLSSTVVEASYCGTGALETVGGRLKEEDYHTSKFFIFSGHQLDQGWTTLFSKGPYQDV